MCHFIMYNKYHTPDRFLITNAHKLLDVFFFLSSKNLTMFELPAELTAKPLALIGLTGLDISNPIHRSIWDAFSNNRRPDCAAIQFKLLSLSHEFPTVKPKV